jgi:hypothetical protein
MSRPLDVQVIERAREIISIPQRWCQLFEALRSDGEDTNPCKKDAARFCAMGALARAAWEIRGCSPEQAGSEAGRIAQTIYSGAGGLPAVNDDPCRGRQAVLGLFDHALDNALQ